MTRVDFLQPRLVPSVKSNMRSNNHPRRLPRVFQFLEALLALLCLAAVGLALLIVVALMGGCADNQTPAQDASSAPAVDSLLCWNHRPPPCPPYPDSRMDAAPSLDADQPDAAPGCSPSHGICPDAGLGSLAQLPDGTYVCVPALGGRPCNL